MAYTLNYSGAQIDDALQAYTTGTINKTITISTGYNMQKQISSSATAPYTTISVSGTILVFKT